VFGLQWQDVALLDPSTSTAAHDLPPGIGAILLKLLVQTKSQQATRADLLIAFPLYSTFSLSGWLQHLLLELGSPDGSNFIFVTHTGTRWLSHFYKHQLLYPFLDLQRLQGDSLLAHFDGSPGLSIEGAFWSFHLKEFLLRYSEMLFIRARPISVAGSVRHFQC
jgi:hypothetical protein